MTLVTRLTLAPPPRLPCCLTPDLGAGKVIVSFVVPAAPSGWIRESRGEGRKATLQAEIGTHYDPNVFVASYIVVGPQFCWPKHAAFAAVEAWFAGYDRLTPGMMAALRPTCVVATRKPGVEAMTPRDEYRFDASLPAGRAEKPGV
ncbi:hypothetical protein Bbelb_095250 [Branchiostoma belcheri]|nr:hypothetical protein Bbelb_095250 [Branchiostoma belcheri]